MGWQRFQASQAAFYYNANSELVKGAPHISTRSQRGDTDCQTCARAKGNQAYRDASQEVAKISFLVFLCSGNSSLYTQICHKYHQRQIHHPAAGRGWLQGMDNSREPQTSSDVTRNPKVSMDLSEEHQNQHWRMKLYLGNCCSCPVHKGMQIPYLLFSATLFHFIFYLILPTCPN